MDIRDPLKRLDERILPPIGRVLARLGRGARRLRVIRVVAVVISLTVVLVAVYAAGRRPAPTYAPTGTTIRLGVPEGGSIPSYVAGSKAKLAQLIAGSTSSANPPSYFALVSMSAYLTPQRLKAVLGDLPVQVTYVFMRAPSPQQTEIFQVYAPDVPQDVDRAMLANADKKQREAADDATLESQTRGSSDSDRTLRAQYQQEGDVARLEEKRYRSPSTCACVYAVVVHATAAVLGQLAARPDVRVVEPGPQLTPDLAIFLPPFPDQHKRAGPPPSSALPATLAPSS